MLPAAHRLRRRRDFGVATRRGRRAGSTTVVAHLAVPSAIAGSRPESDADPAADADAAADAAAAAGSGQPPAPARVGFVVSGAVGPAVVRNQVRRRLRHLSVVQLPRLPDGALLVLRALPAAAEVPSARLADDVAQVLDRLLPADAAA